MLITAKKQLFFAIFLFKHLAVSFFCCTFAADFDKVLHEKRMAEVVWNLISFLYIL